MKNQKNLPQQGENMRAEQDLSRREVLKLTALGVGGWLTRRFLSPRVLPVVQTFPEFPLLGRIAVGKVDLHAKPDADSPSVGVLYEDMVVPWMREVVGTHLYRFNQRWVETPDGYVWAPYVQPTRDQPAAPVEALRETSLGPGMWVEVSVPYVDAVLENPPARSFWLQDRLTLGLPPRFYYGQVLWVDQLRVDDAGQTWYRLNERYGFGDIFWGHAEGFHPITPEEVEPISPEVEEKKVVVDVSRQTLSCFEGSTEVFFCRVSTGALYDDDFSTPVGTTAIWRKMISAHMTGGTTGGGYDLPGIGWTTLFVGNGIAIHATFWHNDYGVPRSHGCVNAKPEDAKWVFRWVNPVVPYDPGDVTVQMPGGTRVQII